MNASDWIGPVGDVWAAEWRRTDRSFADLTPHLNAAILDAAGPYIHRILDIGCGAGATAIAVASERPDTQVMGIDLSPGLIAVARARSDHANLSFEAADVVDAAARHRPDLYISRHGVMFFADPIAAFTSLRKAAAPGARIVFSCFADRAANRWAVETAGATGDGDAPAGTAPGPFAFADDARVRAILAAAGWRDAIARRVTFSYCAGQGADPVADALDYFSRIGPAASLLRASSPDDRPTHIANLTAVCERYRTGDVVAFPASAWIWSARVPAAT